MLSPKLFFFKMEWEILLFVLFVCWSQTHFVAKGDPVLPNFTSQALGFQSTTPMLPVF